MDTPSAAQLTDLHADVVTATTTTVVAALRGKSGPQGVADHIAVIGQDAWDQLAAVPPAQRRAAARVIAAVIVERTDLVTTTIRTSGMDADTTAAWIAAWNVR